MNHKHVIIIGAGPAGCVAAALLKKHDINVTIIEKMVFPRFVIGESLLPYSMTILEEAGLIDCLHSQTSFQYKNGAAFNWGQRFGEFDFSDKFSQGPSSTYQVPRSIFDTLLAREVEKKGVKILFNHSVENYAEKDGKVIITMSNENQINMKIEGDFVLDASGYGRVLPKLLNLDKPSKATSRKAIFTHINDHITDPSYDRNKILIETDPDHRDIWYWLIPFADGRLSIGMVGDQMKLTSNLTLDIFLKNKVNNVPHLQRILQHAVWDNEIPVRTIENYSTDVHQSYGKHFALLGNAGSFLDPVFSSGITIALKSAQLACHTLIKQFNEDLVDWEKDFAQTLAVGVDTFQGFVNAWYNNDLQDIVYTDSQKFDSSIKRKICSVLAGYAWDHTNSYTRNTAHRLQTLAEVCRSL